MQLLTNSRGRVFRDCHRKHHLMYDLGWRPVRQAEVLRVGSLVHDGLEAWFRAIMLGASIDEWAPRALAAVAARAFDVYEQARIDVMLEGYHEHWQHEDLEVVAVEVEFIAPHVNPETFARSRTWQIAGKIDVVVRAPNGLYKVEHKTSSEEIGDPAGAYWTKLAMDSQVSIYHLGGESLGHTFDGCLYDVLRKPGHRPKKATPVDQRKYRQRKTVAEKQLPEQHPALLYKGQRLDDETHDAYYTRVRADVFDDLDRYYRRKDVPRTESQIQEYMYDAWGQAKQMRAMQLAGEKNLQHVPRNPDACHRFGTCAFWQVCSVSGKPEDYHGEYQRVDNVHPELTKVTEEIEGAQA